MLFLSFFPKKTCQIYIITQLTLSRDLFSQIYITLKQFCQVFMSNKANNKAKKRPEEKSSSQVSVVSIRGG
jgi:hypothetical protein